MLTKYQEYLKSPWWQQTRNWVLIFWDHRCSICKSNDRVEIHHNTYERIGHEKMNDLVCLCHACHELYSKHGMIFDHPYPTKEETAILVGQQ